MSNKKYLKFTNYKYEFKAPYVIHADFECFINSNNKHIPSGFGYVVVNWKSEIIYQTCYSEDNNVMDEFFKQILETHANLKQSMSIILPLVMTPEQEHSYINASNCHICGDELKFDKVENHNHMTGDHIGAARNICNLNYKQTMKDSIFFHNLKIYDVGLCLIM